MKDVALVRCRKLTRNVHADFYACPPGFAITVPRIVLGIGLFVKFLVSPKCTLRSQLN